ncbi:MAG: serpin family protein, partial [bacterium]
AHQRGADSNTVVSPLSAGLALALVANGARDATFHALAGTLGAASFDADALAARDSVLLSSLSARHDVTLEVANALWMSPKYHAQPTYLDKAGRAYLSSVRTIALDSASGIAVINAWVNDKTHGRIATILDAPLSDTTALVITNAVYFHGLWLSAFDRAITRPLAYHRRPGVTDSVPAMERTTNLLYLKGAGMQAVRLPYRGGRAALFVLLPDSGVSVDELESRLARDGWPHQLSAYHSHDVHLRLPRVHAEATVDLKGPLKALGSAIAFDCARADFRALLILGAEQNACIDKATQKTYLDIDEEGTEAAAVTATTTLVSTGVVVPPPPIEFIVDRPFLFVLRDEVSGAPLFMGRIVLPGVKR